MGLLCGKRPVVFYGPISFVASSVIQNTYKHTHTQHIALYDTRNNRRMSAT